MKKSSSSYIKVNISTLKAKLTSYLRLVKAGEIVEILDRDNPIARIISLDSTDNSQLKMIKAKRGIAELRKILAQPLSFKSKVDIVQTLREDREKR